MYKKYCCSKCKKEWRSALDSNYVSCIKCGLDPVYSTCCEEECNEIPTQETINEIPKQEIKIIKKKKNESI